jgi:hypothetical protein
MNFDQFAAKWLGQRVGDDSLVTSREETDATKYQCVSLIKQYVRECYGIEAGAWGNAIHYWTQTNQALLTKFAQVANNEARQGDIVILWGVAGNAYGHIGIATGSITSLKLEILEQNGSTGNGTGLGGDAIRTRYVDRSRVAGLLRPQTPSVAYTPAYSIIHYFSPAKWVQINKPTYRWNIGYHDFEEMRNKAMASISPPNRFQIQAIARHVSGNDYYMDNINETSGFHVADCDDYAVPYVPPAPPKEAPLAEKYTLTVPCMAFDTAVNAKHHRGVATTLTAGEYFVIAKDSLNNAYNLSNNNMKDRSQWVNLNDNKLEEVAPTLPVDPPKVVTEPVDMPVVEVPKPKPRIVTRSLRPDGEPVYFKASNPNPIEVTDLSGDGSNPPFFMPAYNDGYNVPIVQTFIVDNVEYGRTKQVAKAGYFYGVRMQWLREAEAPAVQPTSRLDHNGDCKVNIMDITDGIQDFIDYNGKRLYTQTIKTGQTLAVVGEKAKKFVDGYKARRKVQ